LNLDISIVYSDDNYAYHDIISCNILKTGKQNTQKIERKHLTFGTENDLLLQVFYYAQNHGRLAHKHT